MNLKKSAAIAGAGLLAVLGLSGCMRAEVDLYVTPEATVEQVDMTVGVKKAVIAQANAMMGGLAQSFGGGMDGAPVIPDVTLDDFKTMVVEQNPELGSEQACEFTESDAEFLMKCVLADSSVIAEMNQSLTGGDDMTLTLSDGIITMTQATQEQTQNDAASQMLAGMMDMSVVERIHFPGPVESIMGTGAYVDPEDPNVAVIDMMKTDGSTVVITASNGEGGSAFLMYVVGGSVLVVLLGVAAFFLTNGDRRRMEPISESETVAMDESGDIAAGDTVVYADPAGDVAVERTVAVEDAAGDTVVSDEVIESPSEDPDNK